VSSTNPDDSPSENTDVTEESINPDGQTGTRSRLALVAFKSARILLILIIVASGLGWYAYQSTQKIPEFYQAVLTAPPDFMEHQGQEFESRLFELQHQSRDPGQWQAVFTDGQINGWLATDLPEKFPDAIPPQMGHPRIRISEDGLELAFRCQSSRFNGIIVAKGDAFCTERPNEIAVRIKSAKAGIVPLPIGPWVETIVQTLRSAGTETTWTEIDGDPTAIVILPRSLTDNNELRLRLETVQLSAGQLLLGGVTAKAQTASDIKIDEK
jgi:hypothetical protein